MWFVLVFLAASVLSATNAGKGWRLLGGSKKGGGPQLQNSFETPINTLTYEGLIISPSAIPAANLPVGPNFGKSVCSCGNLIYVTDPGSSSTDETKSVYIFKYEATTDTTRPKISYLTKLKESEATQIDPDLQSYHGYGNSISCNANYLFVSYPSAERVYMYDCSSEAPYCTKSVTIKKSNNGSSVRNFGIGLSVDTIQNRNEYVGSPSVDLPFFVMISGDFNSTITGVNSGYVEMYKIDFARSSTKKIAATSMFTLNNSSYSFCGVSSNENGPSPDDRLSVGYGVGAIGCLGRFIGVVCNMTIPSLATCKSHEVIVNPAAKVGSGASPGGILDNSNDKIISESDHAVHVMSSYNYNYMNPNYVPSDEIPDSYYILVSPILTSNTTTKQINNIYVYTNKSVNFIDFYDKFSFSSFDSSMTSSVLGYSLSIGSGSFLSELDDSCSNYFKQKPTREPETRYINNCINNIQVKVSRPDPGNKSVGSYASVVQIRRARTEEVVILTKGKANISHGVDGMITISSKDPSTGTYPVLVVAPVLTVLSETLPLHEVEPITNSDGQKNQFAFGLTIKPLVNNKNQTTSTGSVTLTYGTVRTLMTLNTAAVTYSASLNVFAFGSDSSYKKQSTDNTLTIQYGIGFPLTVVGEVQPQLSGSDDRSLTSVTDSYKISYSYSYSRYLEAEKMFTYNVLEVTPNPTNTNVVGSQNEVTLVLSDSEGTRVSAQQKLCGTSGNSVLVYSFDYSDLISVPVDCNSIAFSEDGLSATFNVEVPSRISGAYPSSAVGDTIAEGINREVSYTIETNGSVYKRTVVGLVSGSAVDVRFGEMFVGYQTDVSMPSNEFTVEFAPIDSFGNIAVDWPAYLSEEVATPCNISAGGITSVTFDGTAITDTVCSRNYEKGLAFSFRHTIDANGMGNPTHPVEITMADGSVFSGVLRVGYGLPASVSYSQGSIQLVSTRRLVICDARNVYIFSDSSLMKMCLDEEARCQNKMTYDAASCSYGFQTIGAGDRVVSFDRNFKEGEVVKTISTVPKFPTEPTLTGVRYSMKVDEQGEYYMSPTSNFLEFVFLDQNAMPAVCEQPMKVLIDGAGAIVLPDPANQLSFEVPLAIDSKTASFVIDVSCGNSAFSNTINIKMGEATSVRFADGDSGLDVTSYNDVEVAFNLFANGVVICDKREATCTADRGEAVVADYDEETCQYKCVVDSGKKGTLSVAIGDNSGYVGSALLNVGYNGGSIFGFVVAGVLCVGVVIGVVMLVICRWRLKCCVKGEHLADMLEDSEGN